LNKDDLHSIGDEVVPRADVHHAAGQGISRHRGRHVRAIRNIAQVRDSVISPVRDID
jgi:hypothetical protein